MDESAKESSIKSQALSLGIPYTNLEGTHQEIRKALGRLDKRDFSRTYYFQDEDEKITLCCRFSRKDKLWSVGWSWRNPDDQYSKKRGKATARRRMLEGIYTLAGYECNPPWATIIRNMLPGSSPIHFPTWVGSWGYRVDFIVSLLDEATCVWKNDSSRKV